MDYHCQVSPVNKSFQITQILDSRDRSIYYAKAGENVKIKVRGLEDEDIKKGFVVTGINEPCHITQEIEAELTLLTLPEHKSILSTGYMSVMHLHSAIEDVFISGIICSIENGKKNPNCTFLKSNMTAIVRIKCLQPLSVEKFADNPQLGSFTLRDEGLTIGMGKILRLKPMNKGTQVQKQVPQ